MPGIFGCSACVLNVITGTDEMHRRLRGVVAELDPKALERTAADSRPAHWLVSGIVAHDLYHAGQIQLLKRLMTKS